MLVAGTYDETFCDNATIEKFNKYLTENSKDKHISPDTLTAIYLAYAMRLSRKYIVELSEYKGVDLEVAFNIGIPIDHIENNKVKKHSRRYYFMHKL